jgi:hypothetical protein
VRLDAAPRPKRVRAFLALDVEAAQIWRSAAAAGDFFSSPLDAIG